MLLLLLLLSVPHPRRAATEYCQLLLLLLLLLRGGDGGRRRLRGGNQVHLSVGRRHHRHDRDGRGGHQRQLNQLRKLDLLLWNLFLFLLCLDDLHLALFFLGDAFLGLFSLLFLLSFAVMHLSHVLAQSVSGDECVFALWTLVPPLARVLTLVSYKRVLVAESHRTLIAGELFLSIMSLQKTTSV